MNTALSPTRAPPLTIEELAARWSFSEAEVRRLIRWGVLDAVRLGPQRTMILAEDADFYERHAIRREPFAAAVYFAQADSTRLIKIGTSLNVRERMKALGTANSERINLRALCPGHTNTESWFHAKFASDRSHGEWFRPSRRLRANVKVLHATFGLPEWTQ